MIIYFGIEKCIPKNGIYNGFISNCDNFENLYIQLVDNEDLLNELHEKINSDSKKVLLKNIVIGLY